MSGKQRDLGSPAAAECANYCAEAAAFKADCFRPDDLNRPGSFDTDRLIIIGQQKSPGIHSPYAQQRHIIAILFDKMRMTAPDIQIGFFCGSAHNAAAQAPVFYKIKVKSGGPKAPGTFFAVEHIGRDFHRRVGQV